MFCAIYKPSGWAKYPYGVSNITKRPNFVFFEVWIGCEVNQVR